MGFFITKGKSVRLLYLFGLECLRIDRSEYKIRIFPGKSCLQSLVVTPMWLRLCERISGFLGDTTWQPMVMT